jgi:ribonuclease HII
MPKCGASTKLSAVRLDRHKGYDTALHRAALQLHGPAPFHRRSFAPVRALLEDAQ